MFFAECLTQEKLSQGLTLHLLQAACGFFFGDAAKRVGIRSEIQAVDSLAWI